MVREDEGTHESTDKSSTDTEDYLDLADLNDFMDSNSPPLWLTEKLRNIEAVLKPTSDLLSEAETIKNLCYSRGGLLNDDVRKKLWPQLVNSQLLDSKNISSDEIINHTYFQQVVLDVKRILKRFPPGLSDSIQADLQVKVTELIVKVLIVNEGYHYYQGFHDIAITLLLALGEEQSFSILSKLAQTHFQLFMGKDMEPTMEILNIVYVLVKKENPKLYEYLVKSELGTIFCLPWALTWFGHVLNDYDIVARLFDVFLSSHPWTSMYLSAKIVLFRASEIFATPCEMPLLHHLLSDVPEDLPFDTLISETKELIKEYPPDIVIYDVKALHAENLRKAAEEQERMRVRMENRKAKLQKTTKAVMRPNRRYQWVALPRSLQTRTLKVVALSISVAAVAIICNYMKPNLEIFP